MAETVNAAFNEFLANKVNLDPEKTKEARASRDWLFEQIASFGTDATFPLLWSEFNLHYGSFARRTKKRPLDDIDLMIGLNAQGATYFESSSSISITVTPNSNLRFFCNDNSNTLNSTRVINKFISKCSDVPQYNKAEIKRNGVAAVLMLSSYDWNFDIVPCFKTAVETWTGRDYYLIPDGSGNWKKTDPRIDRHRVQTVNQKHNGHILDVVRIIKYWNKRPTMPTMPSYLLETMIVDYYNNQLAVASEWVDIEIPKVLAHISTSVNYQVNDPKGIQGNINDLSWDDRNKISARASTDKQKADQARALESAGDHKGSIQKWGEIFGGEFPTYG